MAKEVPWCTVFLCLSALLMHTLTFVGNMDTADSILAMGKSVDGWSDVGLATSTALAEELDALLSNVTYQLTDAINRTIETQETIDGMLSMMSEMVASMAPASSLLLLQTDIATHDNPLGAALQPITEAMSGLPLFQNSLEILQEMFEKLKPTLLQVGVWIETFGDKVQATVETFGTTMDRVQKLFDQVMMQISGVSGENAPVMEHDSYNLFDTDGNGAVSVDDLQNLAQLYAISALDGAKAEELVATYDQDGSNDIDTTEFSDLVTDQSIVGIMATVLREYAKRLSMVAGNVGAARMRSELSANLVGYLQLVASRNITKVGWISEMLSNGTLPLPFTADVMAELAFSKDDPNVLTVVDVGELVVGTMMNLNGAYTQSALDLMTTPEHWDSEGFNPDDQAMAVQAVTGWVQTGPEVAKAVADASLDLTRKPDLHRQLQAFRANEEHKLIAAEAGRLAAKRMISFQKFKRAKRADKRRSRFGSESQQLLLVELLHGVAMTDGPLDQAMAAIAQGVPAKPETLLFAQWLKANATDTADALQQECFEYTGQSSNALDAFNTQIQGMVKKISGFIDQMKAYATPAGIDKLETIVEEYASKALTDIMNAVKKMVLKVVMNVLDQMEAAKNATQDAVSAGLGGGETSLLEWSGKPKRHGIVVKNTSRLTAPKATSVSLSGFQAPLHDTSMHRDLAVRMMREMQDPEAAAGEAADEAIDFVNGVWEQVSTMLRTVLSITPTALDTLKNARKEVSAVSETLDSLFTTLKESGPPIFDQVSTLWTLLWVLYFFFVMPLSMGILYYGFWASGWFGGPVAVTKKEDLALLEAQEGAAAAAEISSDEPPPQPSGFFARCCSCLGGCCDCLRSCHDTQLCFWSFIIIFQFIVLLLFIVSIVFVLLAGVQVFIGTGCAQIYLLGDVKVCTDTLGMMSEFLNTFIVGDGETPLTMTCDHYHLRTCSLIKERMVNSAIFTVVGSFTASILSFQLIFASAQLHERARYNRIKAEKGIPIGDGM